LGIKQLQAVFNDFFVAAFFICTIIYTTSLLLKRAETSEKVFLEMIVILGNTIKILAEKNKLYIAKKFNQVF
jgi:hypothetical protein